MGRWTPSGRGVADSVTTTPVPFPLMLMLLPLPVSSSVNILVSPASQRDAYQTAADRGACSCMLSFVCFDEIGDEDSAQEIFDAVVHFAQRLFDGAGAGEVAGSVDGDAARDEKRPVDRADDLEGGDLFCGLRQRVTTVGSGVRDEEAGLRERLQDLGEKLRRNVVGLGDVLG